MAELWFKIKEVEKKDQHSYIIFWSGREGLRMFNTWGLSDEQLKDPKNIWSKFSEQIVPTENFRIHRLELSEFRQRHDETFDDFYTRCKSKALKCECTDEKEVEEKIIETITAGIRYPSVKKDLLSKSKDFTLKDCLDICRRHEATVSHMARYSALAGQSKDSSNIDAIQKNLCKKCGKDHHKSKPCPAQNSKCRKCGKIGHWKAMCNPQLGQKKKPPGQKKKNKKQSPDSDKKVDNITDNMDDMFESLHFESINVDTVESTDATAVDNRDEVFVDLKVKLAQRAGIHSLRVKVDTGAQGDVLPVRIFRKMFPSLVDIDGFPKPGALKQKPKTSLTAYNGTKITQYGTVVLPCQFNNGKWVSVEFYVTESEGPAIIGFKSSVEMKLLTMHCAVNKKVVSEGSSSKPITGKQDLEKTYPDRFHGIGRFPGEFHITVKDDARPRVVPPRKYPIQLKDEIKAELDRMESLGVIAPVKEPTDWVSALTFRRKENGKLRVCLDPQALNQASKRTYHKTPTLEELTPKFHGAKVFSKLDARHGYWSIVLDKESSLMTTFHSPYGRYRFLRLPFGLKVSQDIFQEKMDMILEQCPGTLGIADDVAVFGKDEAEHDRNLHNLMEVARKYGLIFNIDKCEIKIPCIKFFGCYYDASGVHPDPDKVDALHAIPPPTNVTELQQFLGLATYMSPFIAKLADHTDDLRALTHKDSEWQWTASHQKAFDNVKSLITTECTLTYFDPTKPSVVQVDASMRGLGAALLQDNKPIAFASKALKDAETRYANIERELLAVVFGCTRFHTYLYGSQFVIESDHKPLESIQRKSLANVPPRLQRLMLKIQHYDYEIVYKPGKEMVLADALSRLNPAPGPQIDLDEAIYAVKFSTEKLNDLKMQTSQDSVLRPLMHVIVEGWPEDPKQIPKCIRHFWSCRDELSVDDGLVIKGERIVIPAVLQKEILQQIHSGHQGITKCQLRAKSCVYWHGINKDIEQLVSDCSVCQKYQRSQTAEPLMPHDIPQRPWHTVGTDLFQLGKTEYLIVADYYAKFPIVRKITGKNTSAAVISLTKQIFSEQGIPVKVVSDNGPQYASEEYRKFAEEWNFDHVTSSPRFPQSNGFIERMIQTVKATLKKSHESGTDPYLALLCLRTTPVDNVIPSPGELLTNRKLRSNLPVKIRNNAQNKDEVHGKLSSRQAKQKQYHDATARELPPLLIGQRVTVKDQQTGHWRPAVVKEKCQEPRSYIVETPNGNRLRRNRNHLRDINPVKPVHFAEENPPKSENNDPPVSPNNTAKEKAKTSTDKQTRSGRTVKPPNRLIEQC